MNILRTMHLFWVKNRYLLDLIIYRETLQIKDVKNTSLHIFLLKVLLNEFVLGSASFIGHQVRTSLAISN
jgi:hypothetical protein